LRNLTMRDTVPQLSEILQRWRFLGGECFDRRQRLAVDGLELADDSVEHCLTQRPPCEEVVADRARCAQRCPMGVRAQLRRKGPPIGGDVVAISEPEHYAHVTDLLPVVHPLLRGNRVALLVRQHRREHAPDTALKLTERDSNEVRRRVHAPLIHDPTGIVEVRSGRFAEQAQEAMRPYLAWVSRAPGEWNRAFVAREVHVGIVSA
jgi:hypothetical protein